MKDRETTRGMAQEHKAEEASPISRIPNEMLGAIFKEVKVQETRFICRSYSWFNLLLVSRRWREVALADGSLWVNIPTHSLEGTLCMLKRSRASLIDVEIGVGRSTPTVVVCAVLNHIDRIGHLRVSRGAWRAHDLQTLMQGTEKAASQLRVLEINSMDGGTPPLDSNLLLRNIHLHTLSLDGMEFDWKLFPIPSLEHLSLEQSTPCDPPSWAQLFDAMRQMPLLTFINLNFGEFQLTSAGPLDIKTVNFPNLQDIYLDDASLPAIGYFFSHANMPVLQHALIDSNYDGSPAHPAVYERAIHAILSLLGGRGFAPLGCLNIERDSFSMTATTPRSHRSRRGIWVDCAGAFPPTMVRVIVNQLLLQLQTRATDVVLLFVKTDTDPQDLSKLFAILPHLKTFVVTSGHESVFRCLSAPRSHLQNPEVPVSNLETLKVGTYPPLGHNPDSMKSLACQLYDCLTSRQKSGFALQKLTLAGGDFTTTHVKKLQGIVKKVCRSEMDSPTHYYGGSSSEYADED